MKALVVGFLAFLFAVVAACVYLHFSGVGDAAAEGAATEFQKAGKALDTTLKLPRGM